MLPRSETDTPAHPIRPDPRRTGRLLILAGLVAVGPIESRPARAQDAQAAATRRELQQLLRQRDDAILRLQRRIEDLERRLSAVLPKEVVQASPTQDPPEPSPPNPETAAAPPPGPTRPGPGAVVVDEQAAERALERSLVTTGVLLLPPGAAEVTPTFTYTRTDDDVPVLVIRNGTATGALSREFRRNSFETGLDLDVGLPFDSQLELGLPYNFVDRSTTTGTGDGSKVDEHGGGLGDLAVGLAKTLTREKGWRPDLIGRVTWDTATGESSDNDVPLDGGSHELIFGLTASKSVDPLVFAGNVFYLRSFEDGDFRSGDRVGYSLNAFLAASPETSLRFGFSQTFAGEDEVDGGKVEGTDFSAASFDLGASLVLGPRTLLDVSGSIGATDATADYTVRVSLPIRFDLPVRF